MGDLLSEMPFGKMFACLRIDQLRNMQKMYCNVKNFEVSRNNFGMRKFTHSHSVQGQEINNTEGILQLKAISRVFSSEKYIQTCTGIWNFLKGEIN